MPAAIAGHTVRSETRRIVRQRLTPSAAEPSRQEAGTASSALALIATMIGRIITVRITVARREVRAIELHDEDHRLLARVAEQVFVDPGRDHEDSDQPVDHRGHAGEQPDHRIERPADGAGANSVRKTAANVEITSASTTAPIVVTGVAQISGQAVKYRMP